MASNETEYPTEYLFRVVDLRVSYGYGIDRSYRPIHNYSEDLFVYASGVLLEPTIEGVERVQACLIGKFEDWRDLETREGDEAPSAIGSIDLRDGRLDILTMMPYAGLKVLIDLWSTDAHPFITLTRD